MDLFPAEYELLSLFECEPTLTVPGVPWAYNCLRFDTTRGADRVVCEIEPGDEIVRLTWEHDGSEFVRLDLNWVCGLGVESRDGCEALVGFFREAAIEPFRLQLKPRVHLRWGTAIHPSASANLSGRDDR